MPTLTRRRDRNRHEECWLIYCGDVHVGTIAMRTCNPLGGDPWQWRCGCYPQNGPTLTATEPPRE